MILPPPLTLADASAALAEACRARVEIRVRLNAAQAELDAIHREWAAACDAHATAALAFEHAAVAGR